jgi:hypothetical protein
MLCDVPDGEDVSPMVKSVTAMEDPAALAAAEALKEKLQARLGGVQIELALDWSGAWAEAFEYAAPECGGLLEACQKAGTPAPVVGYELANAAGRVTGQAELAWAAAKVAVLLGDESVAAFKQTGWQAFSPGDQDALLRALAGGQGAP